MLYKKSRITELFDNKQLLLWYDLIDLYQR